MMTECPRGEPRADNHGPQGRGALTSGVELWKGLERCVAAAAVASNKVRLVAKREARTLQCEASRPLPLHLIIVVRQIGLIAAITWLYYLLNSSSLCDVSFARPSLCIYNHWSNL